MILHSRVKLAGLGIGPGRAVQVTSNPSSALRRVLTMSGKMPFTAGALEQKANAINGIAEFVTHPDIRGMGNRDFNTVLVRRLPPLQYFRSPATNAYIPGRALNREAIAHEAFHFVPGLGRSESLARLYGGWRAPAVSAPASERLRSALDRLKAYWMHEGQNYGPQHLGSWMSGLHDLGEWLGVARPIL